jgi:hypothetical protein
MIMPAPVVDQQKQQKQCLESIEKQRALQKVDDIVESIVLPLSGLSLVYIIRRFILKKKNPLAEDFLKFTELDQSAEQQCCESCVWPMSGAVIAPVFGQTVRYVCAVLLVFQSQALARVQLHTPPIQLANLHL